MSTFRTELVRCACGHEFPATVADALHISDRPDVRALILEGLLHSYPCPLCGEWNVVEKTLAYTDFPRRHWFMVFPPGGLARRTEVLGACEESFRRVTVERAPGIVRSWAGEMTRRAVFGLAALREKLVIFDAGLDDRCIEVLKLQLIRWAPLVLHPAMYLHLVEVEGDTLRFEYAPPRSSRTTVLPIPAAMYRQVAQLSPEELRHAAPELVDGLAVDYRTAFVPAAA